MVLLKVNNFMYMTKETFSEERKKRPRICILSLRETCN